MKFIEDNRKVIIIVIIILIIFLLSVIFVNVVHLEGSKLSKETLETEEDWLMYITQKYGDKNSKFEMFFEKIFHEIIY